MWRNLPTRAKASVLNWVCLIDFSCTTAHCPPIFATTFCSPTLELGVDIGSVRTVGQVDPPWSVASLKQRLGRSGRRAGEPQILRFYVREERPDAKGDLFDRLHLDLLRAVATTELLLARWIEPPRPRIC